MKRNIQNLLFSAAILLCCLTASAVGTQPSTGDGSQTNPYRIATLDNLLWFADHVNSGHGTACAILTADITMNTKVLDTDGRPNDGPFETWTPIGKPGTDFAGEFNGNGHTISGLYFNNTNENDVGVFGKAINNAYIHDLGISDSYFYGKDHVGGICGDFASGRIENCWNGATVYAKDWNAGGISGSCYINASIKDCYNIGKIMSCNGRNPSYGGICGAVYENTNVDYTISNSHTLEGKCDKGVYGSLDGGCPASKINNSFVKNAAAFASGEVCYKLNSGVTDGSQKWYQTLGGTDNFPVLNSGHGTVFYGYDGDVLKYSNSPLTPSSIDNVAYIDANGQPQTADNVFIIKNASEQVTWSAGWYVVLQGTDITLAKGAVCNGEVHLILADGAKLTATGDDDNKTPGIRVSDTGNSLAIYGQSAQSGELIANGGYWAAGIGGGHNGSGSNITINGGIVTANGGNSAAGIGGGDRGSGSYITINGGVVTATGGIEAAGIGGGNDGAGLHITINGGIVTANGGDTGAGIGGGWASTVYYSGNYITITGGAVTATGGGMGAGIGGGFGGSCSNISIIGGKVTANGGMGASGIGAGINGTNSYSVEIATTLLVKADNNNPPTTVIPNTGFNLADSLKGKWHVTTEPIIITNYIDTDGQEKTANALEITNGTTTLNAGWYVVRGDNVSTGTLTCNGAVNLILADGTKLTAQGENNKAGIIVSGEGNSLTIYGQTNQTGQLIANGGKYGAGIGGEWYGSGSGSGSNITINGGTVTATGGDNGAGIGGGVDGSGSNITINGGTVTANGRKYGAGIGGGSSGSGSNITITGGVVTAQGGQWAAGIGGGHNSSGSNITINGGTVTATGGNQGAGIGGGSQGSGSYITITGGTVTASGGSNEDGSFIGDGIGAGSSNSSPNSNIFVAVGLSIRADGNNPPIAEVAADRTAETDIASALDGKRYATIRIPQPGVVTYGDNITVSPGFPSGDRVDIGTEIIFTAADRWAENYEFLGFYKESTFVNKITQGVSGLTYTTTATEAGISVYAKYEEFTLTPYIDADGQEQTVNAAEITNETSTLNAGWYVVSGNDVRPGMLTCNGAVHLILADGAKLTATGGDNQAGINVSGGHSLTIYGQSAQSGQLIANGGYSGAGIGGGKEQSGSNITINGGTVTANGGNNGAGIGGGWNGSGSNIIINGGTVTANGGDRGAGIGGGWHSERGGNGSNITINGGTVTATGGLHGAGIGGGYDGSGSNIKVATALTVYADNTNPPTTEISHTDNDIASHTALRYVMVKDVATNAKQDAIDAINAAIDGVTNADIIAIATNAIDAINAATNQHEIEALKEQALAAIAAAKAILNSGLGEMGTPCEDCPAVDVTKGTKTIRLYNPDKVEFKKTE